MAYGDKMIKPVLGRWGLGLSTGTLHSLMCSSVKPSIITVCSDPYMATYRPAPGSNSCVKSSPRSRHKTKIVPVPEVPGRVRNEFRLEMFSSLMNRVICLSRDCNLLCAH